eukprot:CAMPEP_0198307972 /NCGR_PEP_ID=MMETSP1450-20131203/767_1 /TAXON_ID=753684 ORGANISM="Madagascaria erythrocladiodes, Strain CCMP3234" /NCGR_SAMPLE_ID=MMETSP1450 /ASSEMBLY_ACC=CAM_ASM_001115 /LENGTH=105 /DNA_ID=CAMNT_0044010601 /DNA_START=73 /DNA_END=390 /DNA_ORIENTATION=+
MDAAFVGAPLVARATRSPAARKAALSMTASVRKSNAAALAGISAPVLAAAPALAAEGTGAALGVDNALLFIPLTLIPAALFVLFLQFGSTQDNEDFFGGYDERRK